MITENISCTHIRLGRQGENRAREKIFDLTQFIRDYGAGYAVLVHQRPNDTEPYIVPTEQVGDTLHWVVTSADTAVAGLNGCAELRWYVGEDVMAKSEKYRTIVAAALPAETVDPPAGYETWLDDVAKTAARITADRKAVEEAAARQPYPNAETGTWWVWDAESGAYADTSLPYRGQNLPAVTASDDGKFARVVDGAWAAVTIPDAEEAEF